MKLKRGLLILFSLVLLMAYVSISSYGNTSSMVKVYVNGQQITFDVLPININNRLLVPVRAVMEALGADVLWDSSSRVVTAKNHDTIVNMPIDSSIVYKNNNAMSLDVPARLIEGRTFLPFRFVAESLGANVHWDQQNQSVFINKDEAHTFFNINGIALGSSLAEVNSLLGSPKRILLSEYGFKWHVYHENYKDYLQIGIKDNKVVALYSNQSLWDNPYGINVGSNKSIVTTSLTEALKGIVKGNTKYILPDFPDGTEYEVYQLDQSYATIFYDLHKNSTVRGIKVIDKNVEDAYLRPLNTSTELKESFELLVFDLTNAIRVKEGLTPLVWSDVAARAATLHSKDMADHKFFNHINLKGESPFDRMKQIGIRYRTAGENLAAGQQSPIYASEGWMNSEGHRRAILSNYTRLGVGVWFGDANAKYNNYFTQKFYTPL